MVFIKRLGLVEKRLGLGAITPYRYYNKYCTRLVLQVKHKARARVPLLLFSYCFSILYICPVTLQTKHALKLVLTYL